MTQSIVGNAQGGREENLPMDNTFPLEQLERRDYRRGQPCGSNGRLHPGDGTRMGNTYLKSSRRCLAGTRWSSPVPRCLEHVCARDVLCRAWPILAFWTRDSRTGCRYRARKLAGSERLLPAPAPRWDLASFDAVPERPVRRRRMANGPGVHQLHSDASPPATRLDLHDRELRRPFQS